MEEVLSQLPEWAKAPLRKARDTAKAAWYFGKARLCPVCGKTSRCFNPHGVPARIDARCPKCGALERHRLLWLFLNQKSDFFVSKPRKMLHVAPEWFLVPRFQQAVGSGYLTADLNSPQAMVKMDVTDIQFPDESFDIIYCSHVLEHVTDDRKAMRELFRTLRKEGWAILLVPITAKETYEDPSITDPQERLKAFGQKDHVRKYGPDYIDRLREAGFTVVSYKAGDLVKEREEIVRMGLTHASGDIFCCTK